MALRLVEKKIGSMKWEEIRFKDLKVGDTFRMFESIAQSKNQMEQIVVSSARNFVVTKAPQRVLYCKKTKGALPGTQKAWLINVRESISHANYGNARTNDPKFAKLLAKNSVSITEIKDNRLFKAANEL